MSEENKGLVHSYQALEAGMAQGSRYSSVLRKAFIGSESDIRMKTLRALQSCCCPRPGYSAGDMPQCSSFITLP